MVWQFIAGIAIAVAATFALRPKPQTQPPAELSQIKLPTAEDGREIPVLFGCRPIRGANVVWYGDYKTEAIKAKGGKK
jgi:hypothetical protein